MSIGKIKSTKSMHPVRRRNTPFGCFSGEMKYGDFFPNVNASRKKTNQIVTRCGGHFCKFRIGMPVKTKKAWNWFLRKWVFCLSLVVKTTGKNKIMGRRSDVYACAHTCSGNPNSDSQLEFWHSQQPYCLLQLFHVEKVFQYREALCKGVSRQQK